MVLDSLATTALALLSPYLGKASEEFAKKAGGALYDKVGALYQIIRQKFAGDTYAEQTLARVEERPDSEGAKITLKELLEEKIKADPDFAQSLLRVIEDAKSADTNNVLAIGERSVAIGRDNLGNINTGDQMGSKD